MSHVQTGLPGLGTEHLPGAESLLRAPRGCFRGSFPAQASLSFAISQSLLKLMSIAKLHRRLDSL